MLLVSYLRILLWIDLFLDFNLAFTLLVIYHPVMPTYIVGGWHEPRKYLVLEKAGKRRKAWLNTSLILILCCSQMRGSPKDLDYNTLKTHNYTSPMIILETWRINTPLLICIIVSRRTKILLIFWNGIIFLLFVVYLFPYGLKSLWCFLSLKKCFY